jgi:uncharacterized protein (DUF3084 family)
MKTGLIVAVIILGLALVAGGVFYFFLMQDKNILASELQSTRGELASTQAELASTRQTLASDDSELSATRDTLTSTQSDLTATRDTLAVTQTELTTTNETLASKLVELSSANEKYASAQKQMSSLEDSLSNTQKKLAAAQETLGGMGITIAASVECKDVQLVDNAAAKNPSWQQLKTFLQNDKTENHQYILNEYDCSQFSQDVHNHAEAAGIRAAEVQVNFKNELVGHALNAFLTSDYGLVYVDCTGNPDKIAYVKVNQVYKAIRLEWVSTPANVREDTWWNLPGDRYILRDDAGAQMVTSKIKIYW